MKSSLSPMQMIKALPEAERSLFLSQQIDLMRRPFRIMFAIGTLLFFLAVGIDVWGHGATAASWGIGHALALVLLVVALRLLHNNTARMLFGLVYLFMLSSSLAIQVLHEPSRVDLMLVAFAIMPTAFCALCTQTHYSLYAAGASFICPILLLHTLDASSMLWAHYIGFIGLGIAIGDTLRRMRLQVSASLYLARRKLMEQAHRDPLTGLLNRSGWQTATSTALQDASERRLQVSVLFLDIDHFKKVNDEHGHRTGDIVLAQTAQIIMNVIRAHDIAARQGGEEFVIMLPGASIEAASAVGERIRQAVEAEPAPVPKTISIGVAQMLPGEPLDRALHRADEALYEAKNMGRNRLAKARAPVAAEVIPFRARA